MGDRFRFRAWDKSFNKYCENVIVSTINEKITVYGRLVDGRTALIPNSHVVLEQCTGVKDKNGTLIYEGDLLKWSDYDNYPYLVRVSWCDLLCCFAFINEDSKFMANHLEPFWNKDVEVVGNIHENPDLEYEERRW